MKKSRREDSSDFTTSSDLRSPETDRTEDGVLCRPLVVVSPSLSTINPLHYSPFFLSRSSFPESRTYQWRWVVGVRSGSEDLSRCRRHPYLETLVMDLGVCMAWVGWGG